MNNKVKIAIDAMSGENSPKKVIDGIEFYLKKNKDNFFYLYGDKILLNEQISRTKLVNQYSEIINTTDII